MLQPAVMANYEPDLHAYQASYWLSCALPP